MIKQNKHTYIARIFCFCQTKKKAGECTLLTDISSTCCKSEEHPVFLADSMTPYHSFANATHPKHTKDSASDSGLLETLNGVPKQTPFIM